ncbi:MAG: hypothetical protein KA149_03235 [Chitinophagales bacterium]|nr:hypothetical protein [Chitinophagales bacterium]
MQLIFYTIFVVVFFTSCNQSTNISPAMVKTDTIVIVHRDTVFVVQQPATDTIRTIKEQPLVAKPKIKLEEKKETSLLPRQSAHKALQTDTAFNYYVNKRISVKTTPWLNGERWVLLYNLQGEETYRHKDVHKSYSVIAHLTFHSNGAVAQMKISENPGASMYWYETTITFSTTNDPELKTSERKPYEELTTNKPWEYWDRKTKQWKNQEAME